MLYHWYELGHAAMRPARVAAGSLHRLMSDPANPFGQTAAARHAAAACEVFERTTRRYEKPTFGLETTRVGGETVAVTERAVWQRPFVNLIHFERDVPAAVRERDPRVLVVAPMSGHHATLLRGTVEALLPDHEVYITDWQDASEVPVAAGAFDLDDYIVTVRDLLRHLKGDAHVLAICQSAVPVLAAVSLMEADGDPGTPRSMILAGGPIDTRINPTTVNEVAVTRGTEWFRRHVTTPVPWTKRGSGRLVYPGFLQLSGFMSMNFDRHANAHKELFHHLIHGDGDSAEKHRVFYDEYLAVMDLTAEFYLQTIDSVFVRHELARGELMHRGRRVEPDKVRRVALMTIEGEKDDITGVGQCRAAHDLCAFIPDSLRMHYECRGVGHYGIFNGSRFRADIAPRIAQFIRGVDPRGELISVTPAAPRTAQPSLHLGPLGNDNEPSAAAFTFAASSRRDGGAARAIAEPVTEAAPEVSSIAPETTPFRLFALAANLMIDGMVRMHSPLGRRGGEG